MAVLNNGRTTFTSLVHMSEAYKKDYETFKNAYVHVSDIANAVLYANKEIRTLVKLLETIDLEAPVDLDMFLDEKDVDELIRIFKEYHE